MPEKDWFSQFESEKPKEDDFFSQFPSEVSEDEVEEEAPIKSKPKLTLDDELENIFPKKEEKPEGRSLYEHVFNAPKAVTDKATEFAESIRSNEDSPWKARIKGFLGGAAEGAASQLSPANILTLGRGRLPQLAAKIIGGAQAVHGAGEIAEGNTMEGIGDIGFGAITGASGFGGRLNKIADNALASPKVDAASVNLKPTAKQKISELASKGVDNLTPEEVREITRLDTQLKKAARVSESVSPSKSVEEIPTDFTSSPSKVESPVKKPVEQPITKEEIQAFLDSKKQIQNPPLILDEAGRPIAPSQTDILPRPEGPWDNNTDLMNTDINTGMKTVGRGTTDLDTSIRQIDEPIVSQIDPSIGETEGLIGQLRNNLKSLPPRGHYVDDPNFITGSPKRLGEGVIPSIRPETPESIMRRQVIDESGISPEINLSLASNKPTAKFVGYQEDGMGGALPLYNIEGGPSGNSTVSPKELAKQGIEVPETPPFTGAKEIPLPVREVLLKSGIPDEEISQIPFDEAINKAREIRRGGQTDMKKQVPIKKETGEVRNPVASVGKLRAALEESASVRPTIEHARSLERSSRVSQMESISTPGLAGHYQKLGVLKGELPTTELMNKLDQSDVDSLIDGVTNSELLPYQKINASVGLTKLLAGKPVAPYEAKLLTQVYGDDIGQILQLHGGIGFTGANEKAISEVLNLPRTLMSTLDFSAPFRQGLGLVHKKEFWKSYKEMFKYAGDEAALNGLHQALEQRPKFHLGEQAGLFLSDVGQNLGKREENFLSGLVDKAPILGAAKKGSERAYTGFLNKLRADVFDNLIDQAKKAGKIVENADGSPTKEALDLAEFVNNATGRGDLGSFKRSADIVNGLFFSPSLMASRIRLLNPKYYLDPKISPQARKESLKSLLAIATAGSLISGVLNQAGADVSLDPTSSDFGKAKFGNTRLDPFGGFQQYVVAASRLLSGKTTTTSGKTHNLWESKYPNPNIVSVIGDFASSKESPVASFIHTLLQGEQSFPPKGIGEKLGPNKVSAEIINRFTPMIVNDLTEIYEEDPDVLPFGLKVALGVGAASGMGVQRFEKKPSSPFRMNMSIGQP